MTTMHDELLAAGIRKQITTLEALLAELENNPVQDKQLFLKTRDVEAKLRELRIHLMPRPL